RVIASFEFDYLFCIDNVLCLLVVQVACLDRQALRQLDDHVRDKLSIELSQVRGVAHLGAIRRDDVVTIAARAVRFDFDLFEFVSPVLISAIGTGGDIESDLAIDLVSIVSVREDSYDFALEFRLGLVGLMRAAPNNEIDHERRGNSYKDSQ